MKLKHIGMVCLAMLPLTALGYEYYNFDTTPQMSTPSSRASLDAIMRNPALEQMLLQQEREKYQQQQLEMQQRQLWELQQMREQYQRNSRGY